MTGDREVLLRLAREVIEAEAGAIANLVPLLDARFLEGVELLAAASGRVIVTGMGKSGLIGAKLAATFCSTGTPAFFLHTADALHGDLGLVTVDDVVIALSKSGRTAELSQLLPLFERLKVPIVAMTADPDSPLARAARVVLPLPSLREAGPEELIPTASTAAMMALGDALAVALMHRRGFDAAALSFVHAGGVIGRQAGVTVGDLMHGGDGLPRVADSVTLREALVEILGKKLGMTTVIAANGRLAGVVTDGDLKRIFLSERGATALDAPVTDFMSHAPRTIEPGASIARAVQRMEDPGRGLITSLVVIDDDDRPIGVLHLHDCLRPA
jgi:arabinose-5-phosphate isomerase